MERSQSLPAPTVNLRPDGQPAGEAPAAPVAASGSPAPEAQGAVDPMMQPTVHYSPQTSDGETPPSATFGMIHVPGHEILGELGRGGMGVVYRARQTKLNRLVALKMILSGGHASSDDLVRFKMEAEAVACLEHPHIIKIYEVNEVEGRPYFSLEFCAGGSLADKLNGTPWPPVKAAELILVLARAIHAAHQVGIVHRDLKPANVLLAADGSPRITDFGLAKRMDSVHGPTRTGDVMGTPSYMAPEQASGNSHKVGPVTDVYALGALLYELLTGRPPFRAATQLETVLQVLNADLVPPRKLQPRLPRDLETVCLQCLRREPHKRPHSAQALADDLQRFLNGEPILARRPSFFERGLLWSRKRPTAAILAAGGVVAFVALVLIGIFSYREYQASRANALVQSLVKADLGEVPRLLEEMKTYRGWTERRLRRLAAAQKNLKESAHLRLSLALVDSDPRTQLPYLKQRLVDCTIAELVLICAALEPFKDELIGPLKEELAGSDQPMARFHAGLALARYAPDDIDWSGDDLNFLTAQLLDSSRDDQRDIRSFLRPLRQRLIAPLETAFHDEQARTTARLAAADALADLAGDDPEFLARLACEATLEQFDSLRPRLLHPANRAQAQLVLRRLVAEEPAPMMTPEERVRLGKRRAGAAALLAQMEDVPSACLALRTTDDPESMTQVIHQVKDRRAPAGILLDALAGATEVGVRYALLLALGDYPLAELSPADQKQWSETLREWYRHDPDAGIHSACGWLLRRWGQAAQIQEIDRAAPSYDPSGQRRWFVEWIAGQPYTFVVCRPGTFPMGSPENEPYRQRNEKLHEVTLTRSFALCDRELTWAQAEPFLKAAGFDPREPDEPVAPDHPVNRLHYGDAVLFCRWLTTQAGRPESEQCYDDPGPRATAIERILKSNVVHPDRPGFRLPTEAEWEYACRAGTTTAYSFGNDRDLLRHYGRYLGQGSLPAATLRPNPWGLFDMHGNVWEWCQDWYRSQPVEGEMDPVGPATGHNRVLRGGGWDRSAWHCRSAYRHSPTPDYRASYMGFRIARTLPGG